MELVTYFNDFLKDIRLTENQQNDLIQGHKTLSKRLNSSEDLKDIIVGMFLQGSYKRSTAVRPKNGNRSDVDLVVVTNLDKDNVTPEEALDKFIPFMEKYYKDKYRKQRRSIGIELSYVELDVVVTTAPSESSKLVIESEFIQDTQELEFVDEEVDTSDWKSEPLYIPDTTDDIWDKTDPLEQIIWTIQKNKNCNGNYVNVVKALKWWKKNIDTNNEPPKSYPLEHLIGQSCPDEISSVAEGVTLTLEYIVENYKEKPVMNDHGVPEHDVFERITDDEYDSFYELIKSAATTARQALDSPDKKESINGWKSLFGSKFPDDKSENRASFTQRNSVSEVTVERYA